MCTVSFIARKNGYALAMNRDEKLARVAGLPPKLREVDGRAVLCPSEPGGGSWIALNDAGATLALVNWYSVTARVEAGALSRGEVVNAVSAVSGQEAAGAALARLPLARINPFRLIGVFPETNEIFEWRWDLKRLGCKRHGWKPRQWISSGFDEPKAQRVRSAAFKRAQNENLANGPGWIRRLHRSHVPVCGPFSTCMHRHDAATVSYTEIVISSRQAIMRYQSGAPCSTSEHYARQLRLRP